MSVKTKKSRSRFEFALFTGGKTDEFVVHAEKYTKEEAVELFMEETSGIKGFLIPETEGIEKKYVRYYVKTPYWCGYDNDEPDHGCYTYCGKTERGSFPVWVITLEYDKEGA